LVEGELKYYFVVYLWRNYGLGWNCSSELINIHPIAWLVKLREKYGKEAEYELVNWKEISKELYDKYKETID